MVAHIKNSLDGILNKGYNTWQINLLKNWDSIAGNLKTRMHIEKIYEDSIVLGVYDSCWMQELYLLSNLIINKINLGLDKPRIKSIRFKQTGYQKSKAVKRDVVVQDDDYIQIYIEPNAEELLALKRIKDPQLYEALKKFLVKCHHQKK